MEAVPPPPPVAAVVVVILFSCRAEPPTLPRRLNWRWIRLWSCAGEGSRPCCEVGDGAKAKSSQRRASFPLSTLTSLARGRGGFEVTGDSISGEGTCLAAGADRTAVAIGCPGGCCGCCRCCRCCCCDGLESEGALLGRESTPNLWPSGRGVRRALVVAAAAADVVDVAVDGAGAGAGAGVEVVDVVEAVEALGSWSGSEVQGDRRGVESLSTASSRACSSALLAVLRSSFLSFWLAGAAAVVVVMLLAALAVAEVDVAAGSAAAAAVLADEEEDDDGRRSSAARREKRRSFSAGIVSAAAGIAGAGGRRRS